MLETARKGYWKANPDQLKNLASLHAELVGKYGAGCSGFVCDNAKLQSFIGRQVSVQQAQQYKEKIESARNESVSNDEKSVVLKKDRSLQNDEAIPLERISSFDLALISFFWLVVIFFMVYFIRRRSQKNKRRK